MIENAQMWKQKKGIRCMLPPLLFIEQEEKIFFFTYLQ